MLILQNIKLTYVEAEFETNGDISTWAFLLYHACGFTQIHSFQTLLQNKFIFTIGLDFWSHEHSI